MTSRSVILEIHSITVRQEFTSFNSVIIHHPGFPQRRLGKENPWTGMYSCMKRGWRMFHWTRGTKNAAEIKVTMRASKLVRFLWIAIVLLFVLLYFGPTVFISTGRLRREWVFALVSRQTFWSISPLATVKYIVLQYSTFSAVPASWADVTLYNMALLAAKKEC
jgi:hypothetical protein